MVARTPTYTIEVTGYEHEQILKVAHELIAVRIQLAGRRLRDLQNRYPEIVNARTDEISVGRVILEALGRELNHQQKVARDLEQGNDRG